MMRQRDSYVGRGRFRSKHRSFNLALFMFAVLVTTTLRLSATGSQYTAFVDALSGADGFNLNGLGLKSLRPNSTSANFGPFMLQAWVKDGQIWKLTLGEKGYGGKPIAIVSKLDGGDAASVTVNYDSTTSKVKVPSKLKRVAMSAVGSVVGTNTSIDDLDWSLDLAAKDGIEFSATSEAGKLAYDAAVNYEAQPAEGLSLRYAFDAKRRTAQEADGANLLQAWMPDWIRQGFGLRYASKFGNVKLGMMKPEPEGTFDFSGEYQITGPSSRFFKSPQAKLLASLKGGKPSYAIDLNTINPFGVKSGVNLNIVDGKATLKGAGSIALSREVVPGVSLTAGTGVKLAPVFKKDLVSEGGPFGSEVAPISMQVSADLARVTPDVAGAGSAVEAHTQFDTGAKSFTGTGASIQLASKPLGPFNFALKGVVDDKTISGQVKIDGAMSGEAGDLDMRYEGQMSGLNSHKEFAEVVYTPPKSVADVARTASLFTGQPVLSKALDHAGAAVFARVTKSSADYEGKPRLQVGVKYDFNPSGKFGLASDSILYDNFKTDGDVLDADGQAVKDHESSLARGKTEALKQRINGAGKELDQHWIMQ